MKTITILLALFLGGCGADWFPEHAAPANNTANTVILDSDPTDVGTYKASTRLGAGTYTVKTSRGIFSTYTSLAVPVGSAVTMEVYTDPESKLLVGKLLRSLTKNILIKEVLYISNTDTLN